MKKIFTPLLLGVVLSLSAQDIQGCTDAPNGQYPENVYTPSCSGNIEYITEYGYSGEYSKVQLTAGVNYEFQGSISSDFLTITNENGNEVLVSGTNKVNFTPSENMIIRFYLHTNSNCGSDYDDLKIRSVKCSSIPTSYCAPNLDCSDGASINSVSINDFINESACGVNGYNDFTSNIINIEKGSTNQIDVAIGYGWYNQSVSMWIDFNNNFQFDENEFYYLGSGTNQVINGTFTLPSDVELGEYRMRLRVATVDQNTATWDKSCDISQYYGETEDYTLAVVENLNTNDLSTIKLELSPNPVVDILRINTIENVKFIQIFDISGKEILKTEAKRIIDVKHFKKGIYVVKITNKKGEIESHKIIKK